ncbi:amidohydrolase [Oceanirhabdus seepicola]|uniref:Amidohydrolase n=1 Tax=Oceanirhabdus seepicola TaxID=2828781 RepID=A0A9J6P020_9CLOT|nr:amidohydrolase [Oceanirhabdus seepicola]MCM1989875.1 amidohydrolase [Oceanirhabdus seepicola]
MLFLKNAEIHTMVGETIENGQILIENGKIKAIGKEVKCPEGAEVIECEGGFVMPGLIDAHSHLGMWENAMGFEGSDGNEACDPVTPHLRAIDGMNPKDEFFREALEAGVTTVASGPGSANVIGGQYAIVKTHGDRIDDMIINESFAMKCAFGENPKRVYNAQKKSPSTRMATAAILRENLAKAKEYAAKKDRANGDLEKMPAFDMKMEALERVIRKEIPLKSHAHRSDDILTSLRIAKEFDVDITLDHCTEGHLIVDYLKEGYQKGIIVGPTMSSRSKIELKNLTFDTPGILSNAGIKIAIMTDHPVIPQEYLMVCVALAARAGMKEEDALKAVTINAAEIIGIGDRVGSLEEGKDGDIVVYTGHPFDLRSQVKNVIIDGKVVK